MQKLVDQILAALGLQTIWEPMFKGGDSGDLVLAISGRRQLTSYSCGLAAAQIVGKLLRPKYGNRRVAAHLKPDPLWGLSNRALTKALRLAGIRVTECRSLNRERVKQALKQGKPILTLLAREDESHWVVIYGIGRSTVYLSGIGFPYLSWFTGGHRIKWSEFRKEWDVKGYGLVCS